MYTLARIRPELDADLYDQLLAREPERNFSSTSYGPPYREYVEWEQKGDSDGFIAFYELDSPVAGARKADQDSWYYNGPSSSKLLAALATRNAMQPILAGYGIDIRSIDHPQTDILLEAQTITVQYPSPQNFVANAQRIDTNPHKTFQPSVQFELFEGDYYTAEQAIGKFAADRTVLIADNFGSHDVLVHATSWLCLQKDSIEKLQQHAREVYDVPHSPDRIRRVGRLMSQLDALINPLIVGNIYSGKTFYAEELSKLTGETEVVFQRKLAEHMNAPGSLSVAAAA